MIKGIEACEDIKREAALASVIALEGGGEVAGVRRVALIGRCFVVHVANFAAVLPSREKEEKLIAYFGGEYLDERPQQHPEEYLRLNVEPVKRKRLVRTRLPLRGE